jgi:hypothetical protein
MEPYSYAREKSGGDPTAAAATWCIQPSCLTLLGTARVLGCVDILVAHVRLQGTAFGTIVDVRRLHRAFELQHTSILKSDT